LAANRQHAAASRVSLRALHRERCRRDGHRIRAWLRRHPGGFDDQLDRARRRFSTRIGTDMGRKIGKYVVQHIMQPMAVAASQ
jgi:hypothetical protein